MVVIFIAMGAACWMVLGVHGGDGSPTASLPTSLPETEHKAVSAKRDSSDAEAIAQSTSVKKDESGGQRPGDLPHPITPGRVRIQRENQLIGALNDAVDLSDGSRLRDVLTDYAREFPDDPNHLQLGYKLIADCLESPSAATRAAGREYFKQERGSILRRFVARHCLGK